MLLLIHPCMALAAIFPGWSRIAGQCFLWCVGGFFWCSNKHGICFVNVSHATNRSACPLLAFFLFDWVCYDILCRSIICLDMGGWLWMSHLYEYLTKHFSVFALVKMPAIFASAAEDITWQRTEYSDRIGPFNAGLIAGGLLGSLLGELRKKWPPTCDRASDLVLYKASECTKITMSKEW